MKPIAKNVNPHLAQPTRAEIVDQFVAIREMVKRWKPNVNPHLARFAELEETILGWYEDRPASDKIIAEGELFKLPISAGRMKSSVRNVAAFFKLIGQRKYLSFCLPSLGTINELIPKDQRKRFILTEQTGNRTIGEPVLIETA